jgi:hypothetical protein
MKECVINSSDLERDMWCNVVNTTKTFKFHTTWKIPGRAENLFSL